MGMLLASLIVLVLSSQMDALMVDGARDRALDQLHLAVINELRAADFVAPYTADGMADLSARLAPVIARVRGRGSEIIRVNIVGPDGTILFSDKPSLVGTLIPADETLEFAAALSGSAGSATRFELSPDDKEDLRAQFDDMAEVYVPIALGGRVVGAYEIYQDTRPIRPVLIWVWVTIVLASVTLFRVVGRLAGANDAQRRPSCAPAPARGDTGLPAVTVRSESTARLTRRELQVLRLMATSHGYREIASELVVSEETVRTHAKSILHKLRQPDRTRAVVAAVAAGILELPRRIDASAQGPLDAGTAATTTGEP